jgi:hypothetical protein
VSFEQSDNAVAAPSYWKYTRDDLVKLADRIDAHQPSATLPSAA